MIKLPIKMLIM